jgi:hypothetical protein
LTKKSVHR